MNGYPFKFSSEIYSSDQENDSYFTDTFRNVSVWWAVWDDT